MRERETDREKLRSHLHILMRYLHENELIN